MLDEHRRAGRIRVYGGSNWSTARFDEANEYARANGRHEFEVLSNHFGLAEAYDVPWAGCRHATDAASKRWLEERQVPLLPWSSQARGFFTGRAKPGTPATPNSSAATTATRTSNGSVARRSSASGSAFPRRRSPSRTC
ncbi:aldo/keto reductase [Curtobacterium flaccumfaciens]|nr:aldo/keto reductase [Curtobacterium flaccumfaciens]